jgi:hypothetical protein
MVVLDFSNRVSNFIDAADVSGNIKNSPDNLLYLNHIDSACKEAGMTTGAVYPFIGGNATSHSFNFLNPAQFRIDWLGEVTHNNLGVQGDGSTGYGDTNLKPNAIGNNVFLGTYINTNNASASWDIGTLGFGLVTRWSDNSIIVNNSNIGNTVISSTLNNIGFTAFNANNSVIDLYKSTTLIATLNRTFTNQSSLNIALLGLNDGGLINRWSNNRQSLTLMVNSINKDRIATFSHNIYTAQRILGRA